MTRLKQGPSSATELFEKIGRDANAGSPRVNMVKRHLLKSNEVIEFGDYKINFVDETDYTGENFLFSRMVRTKTVKPINE